MRSASCWRTSWNSAVCEASSICPIRWRWAASERWFQRASATPSLGGRYGSFMGSTVYRVFNATFRLVSTNNSETLQREYRCGCRMGQACRHGHSNGRGGIELVKDSDTQRTQPSRAYRRLTRDDRTFIEMAINSSPAWSLRAIAVHLAVAVSTVSREI